MYLIFNRYMGIQVDELKDAIRMAKLNAAAVVDLSTGQTVSDFRTEESENDEKG